MRIPHPSEIVDNCLAAPHHKERLFCDLSCPAVQRLSAIASTSSYPKGASLFVEGQAPHGVFIVREGRVKLSKSSADGKTLKLRIADAGEALGVVATMSGKPYYATADVLEPTRADFIGRVDFLSFLREHGEAALRVVEQLSEDYLHVLSKLRAIGLSDPTGEKLTRFLVDLYPSHKDRKAEICLELKLTHEEIAQMIGLSRETVTHLLKEFEEEQMIQIKGSTLIIRNKKALENLAGM